MARGKSERKKAREQTAKAKKAERRRRRQAKRKGIPVEHRPGVVVIRAPMPGLPPDSDGRKVRLSFESFQGDYPHLGGLAALISHAQQLSDLLVQLTGQTWDEVLKQPRNKYLSEDKRHKTCPEALKRIEQQLELQDIFEIGAGAKFRIFGYRRNEVYYLLWVDPEHLVCPSVPK